MKEAVASPFAALNSKEQMEQWAIWHSQHMEEKPTTPIKEPESVCEPAKPTTSREAYRPHHSQYDAVVGRIRNAQRRATAYISCASSESTRQC